MSVTLLNLGTSANDGTGDSLRAGGQKINDNFTDLDTRVTTAQTDADAAQADIDGHEADLANPHQVTKSQVGLGNVDNTSDATKNSAVAALTNKDLTSGTNTFPTFNQNTTGSAGTLSPGRNIDGQLFDGSADITVIAPGTHAATSKGTPVDLDEVPIVDSEASNVLKKLTWSNLKATLKTYLDTLYLSLAGGDLTGQVRWGFGSSISLGATATPRIQVAGTTNNTSSISLLRWSADVSAPIVNFGKSRGTTVGTLPGGAVTLNTRIGSFNCYGDDGVNSTFQLAAGFQAIAMENWTDVSHGTDFILIGTPSGSTSASEVFRASPTNGLQMFGTNTVIDQNRHFAPRSYTIATLPSAATTARIIWCSDLGGGAGQLNSDGTNWKRVRESGYEAISTNADATILTFANAINIRHTGTLTADRNLTFSATNAYPGARKVVTRTGAGAFNLNLVNGGGGGGTLKALTTGTWAEVVYDGTNWFLAAYGAL